MVSKHTFWARTSPKQKKVTEASYFSSVLRVRDVYFGSRIRIFPSRIQGLEDNGSRIEIRIKEL